MIVVSTGAIVFVVAVVAFFVPAVVESLLQTNVDLPIRLFGLSTLRAHDQRRKQRHRHRHRHRPAPVGLPQQVNSDGEPVMDFGHIYQTLALLDAGSEEKILLTSRDKRSLLVVSFADVKRCIEEAFLEISGHAGPPPPASGGGGGGGGGAGAATAAAAGTQGVSGSQGGLLPGGRGMGMGVVRMHGGAPGVGGGGGLVHGHGHGHQGVGVPMGHGMHHPHPHGVAMGMGMVGHPAPPPPHGAGGGGPGGLY